jgi:hypothetical protein
MFKKPWFLASLAVAVVGAIIGAIVFVGTVLQPKWEAEQLAANNLKACDIFVAAVKNADKQPTMSLAYNTIFRGVNKAIEVYDPTGASKKLTFGPEYDALTNFAQIEYQSNTTDPKVFYQLVGSGIQTISEGCNALKATPTPTPSN